MKFATRLRRARRAARNLARNSLALILSLFMITACDGSLVALLQSQTPEPRAGIRDYQSPLLVGVPGGLANVAGGNLFVQPGGLSLDTSLGVEAIEPVYNSATGEWRFGILQMTYDGETFVDPTGAVYDTSLVPDGGTLPGSVWVKLDGDTLMTKDGLAFEFGAQGELVAKHRLGQQCPRILYEDQAAGPAAQLEIRQVGCGTRGEWSVFNTDLFVVELGPEGWVEGVSDRAGRVARYSYDAGGRLTTARDGLDVEQGWPGHRFEYDFVNGRLASVTNSEGERVEYEYYAPNPLASPRLQFATQVAQAGESSLSYRLDYHAGATPGVFETVVTDPMGDTRRFHFDASRRVLEIAFEAVAESEVFSYAGEELRPASHRFANGTTESYTRDASGDILTITQPSGNVVVHTYADANGAFPGQRAMAEKRDDLGLLGAWTYTEDAPVDYKRLATAANGEGETIRTAWHPMGGYTRLASITWANDVVQEFSDYEPLGHATRIRHGDIVGNVAYDDAGNRTQGSDSGAPELGGVLARRFDADRNPVEVTVAGTDAQESLIHLPRGSDGRILYIDRPPLGLGAGPDHRFVYDSLGRAVAREEHVDGVWQVTSFEYNGRGQRTAENLPNGMRRERAYDQRGRLRESRAYRNGELEGEARFDYAGGNLVSLDDSLRGLETYSYDAAGRLAAIQYAGGEWLATEYDLRSRLVKETYHQPDSSVLKEVRHEYDLANRETRVFDDGQLVLDRTFVDGQLDCIETGNGLTRCFSYDPVFGSMNGAVTTNAAQELLERTTLAAGLTGNPPNWQAQVATELAGLGNVAASFTVGPGTDPTLAGSEVGKRVLAWDDGNGDSQAYAYDGLSNQIDDTDGDLYDYNAEGNRLLGASVDGVSVTYSYDAAGFADMRDGVPIGWTALGRMAAYGPFEVEWDMQGRPLRATDASVSPSAVRDWSRWGGRIEVDGDGFLVALDLGEVVLGFGQAQRYRHFDFRGNVSFVSDENGEAVTLYGYEATGVDRVIGDGSDATRFVGRSQAGPFLWLGERMLDPLVGRFISPDPVFNLLNQYTYTLGNPVWFRDPNGRYGVTGNAVQVGVDAMVMTLSFVAVAVAVTAGGGLAIGLSIALAGYSIYGFVHSVSAFAPAPPAQLPETAGCSCSPSVTFGNDASQSDVPTGAAPPAQGGDEGVVSGPSAAAAGFGAGVGIGVGGGIGGVPACGLTGIEFLAFVGLLLRRKQRGKQCPRA